MPPADSCGDPFVEEHIDGFLPGGCGAEPVFNFSLERIIQPFGSGDDDDYDDDKIDDPKPVTTVRTTVIPAKALLSTASHHDATKSTKSIVVSVTPKRSASRLPPRFTPSPAIRHSSFQHLLRIHLNTFNQRLSMLESNTLDMKESIRSMEDQQTLLNSHLKELIAVHSAGEKDKKITHLEKSYDDMEARLSRLEGRLEILIDGFTALAQEMNKMKRARHISRSPQEKRLPPPLTTVLPVPLFSTPPPPIKFIPTETPPTSRATVPQNIPTPGLLAKKRAHVSASQGDRKGKSAGTTKSVKNATKPRAKTKSSNSSVTSKPAIKPKTTLGKPKSRATVSQSIPTPAVMASKRTKISAPEKDRRVKSAASAKSDKRATKPQTVTQSSKSNIASKPTLKKTTSGKPKSRATVSQSIPAPAVANKRSKVSAPGKERRLESASATKPVKATKPQATRTKPKTTLSKPKTVPKSTSRTTVKPETKRPQGRRSSVTAKHISQPKQTESEQDKQEATITKFQLEPPSHKPKPPGTRQLHKQSDQAHEKDPAAVIKSSGRSKTFRSNAPAQKKTQSNPKKWLKPVKGNSEHMVTTAKPAKTATVRKAKSAIKRTSPAKIKATARKTSTPRESTSVRKATKKTKKKTNSNSGAVDLLSLLNGEYKPAKQRKNREGSLHIVLGKLAIPIKIIPDN